MFSASLFSRLSADSGVKPLIGNADGSVRMFPDYVPGSGEIYPLIRYETKDLDVDKTFDGFSGISYIVATLVCVGSDYESAESLATAVINSLDGQTGSWGPYYVQGAFLEDAGTTEAVRYEAGAPDQVMLLYEKQCVFQIAFNNP